MAQTLQQALNRANPISDGREYALIKLPPKAITAAAGVLAPDDGARIAEQAANRAEAGGHTLRERIAEALRRIIAR
jgi:hypothetical protein